MTRSRRWLWIAFACALLLQTVESYQFASFEFDKVNHVAATSSWLHGRGLTIPDVSPRGLPHAVYRPLLGFTPGYALVLAPVLRTTHDIWWSTFVVDVAAQALFLGAWMVLLLAAGCSPGVTAAVLLLWSMLYGPSTTQTYSDLLALALFAAALASSILCGGRRHPLPAGVASGLLMAAACVARYAYWPLAAVVPLAAIVAWRDRAALMIAAIHAVLAGAAIAGTSWFMQRTTGEALFLSRWYPEAQRGLFWSHLRSLYPFPAQAFGIDRIADRAAALRPDLASALTLFVWACAMAVTVVSLLFIVPRALQLLRGVLPPDEAFVEAGNIATCAGTIAMVAWLAIRLPAASDGWTVGRESRYFLPVLPPIVVWVMRAAARMRDSPGVVSLGAAGLIALMMAAVVPFRVLREIRYVDKTVNTAWLSAARRNEAGVLASAIDAVSDGREPPLVVDTDPKWRLYVETMAGALVVKPQALPACDRSDDHVPAQFLMVVPRRDPGRLEVLRAGRAAVPVAALDLEGADVFAAPYCP